MTPTQRDRSQKNTQKAQKRGCVSYISASPSVWVLDLCFKSRRLEKQIAGNVDILQMIAALVSPCHLRAKDLSLVYGASPAKVWFGSCRWA